MPWPKSETQQINPPHLLIAPLKRIIVLQLSPPRCQDKMLAVKATLRTFFNLKLTVS